MLSRIGHISSFNNFDVQYHILKIFHFHLGICKNVDRVTIKDGYLTFVIAAYGRALKHDGKMLS